MGRRVIAVTGLPGAWLNQASKTLQSLGCSSLWPGQNTDMRGFPERINDGENPELLWIHTAILAQHNQGHFTDNAPRYYDSPYPGPQEFLAQFSETQDILLVDNRLCLFLPLWRAWVTDVVVCDFDLEESARVIAKWTNTFSHQGVIWTRSVATHFATRLQCHIEGVPNLIVLPHQTMLDGSFRGMLDQFKNHN